MSSFSIHLSESLSDAEAKRVAQVIAPTLRGSPERLHLLLLKQPGSRIARASSQRQAETVAGILRNAGVKVEVLETVGDAATPQNSLAPNPDPFAAPSIPPLAPPPNSDIFPSVPIKSSLETSRNLPEAPADDPFAAPKFDPFSASTPLTDPFAAPKSDPFSASTPPTDPFAAPKSDPFSASTPLTDPFAAPKSDPFSAPSKTDPFAAPLPRTRAAPEVSTPDPFAAPGVAVVLDTKATQTDLPAQARRARDRVFPRSKIQTRLFQALVIPYLLVAAGAIAFMFYQLPQIYREELGARAYQAAVGEAESNADLVAQLPNSTQALEVEAKGDLEQIPDAVAVIYDAEIMEISTDNTYAAHASTLDMTVGEAKALEPQFKDLERQNKRFGIIQFRNKSYIGSIAKVKTEEDKKVIGEVHVLFSLDQIGAGVFQNLIPLFVALGLIAIFAAFGANLLAASIARPIVAATEQANRIALGDLDRSVSIESNDEIGDMLGSLERMRVSLKSMVARMRRNT
ncbi:MAG: HAMP domain-containing protein [Deinococcales bacterium]